MGSHRNQVVHQALDPGPVLPTSRRSYVGHVLYSGTSRRKARKREWKKLRKHNSRNSGKVNKLGVVSAQRSGSQRVRDRAHPCVVDAQVAVFPPLSIRASD